MAITRAHCESAVQPMSSLQYPPVDHPESIRVLHLTPGQNEDPIVCTLQVCNLDVDKPDLLPSYTALSYTWGDARDTYQITCNGANLTITRNLEAALCHLRQRETSMCLWIDAICINQSDVDEKSRQIVKMSEIFAAASETICWLGPGTEDSDLAMDLITQMAAVVKKPGPAGELSFSNLSASNIPVNDRFYEVLCDFFYRRPWFRRVWVRQEIAFSEVLIMVCGAKRLDWEPFAKVARSLAVNTTIKPSQDVDYRHPGQIADMSSLLIIKTTAGTMLEDEGSFDMCTLLLLCHDCEATLAVDKVYGLLGLTAEIETPELAPNYRLSVQSVYVQLAKTLLQRPNADLGPLAVLYLAGLKQEQKWGLPTWVPQLQPLLHIPFRFGMRYNASGEKEPRFRFKSDADKLFISGQVIDSISTQASVISALDFRDSTAAMEEVKSWLADCGAVAKLCDPYPGEISWQNAYWQTLSANKSQAVERPQPELGDCFQYLQDFLDWAEDADQEMKEWKSNEENLEKGRKFWVSMQYGALGRHFFASKKGYMGVAPLMAEVGDMICILYGAQVPFLLRPRDDHYLLVGDCYVHGIMEGQAMDWKDTTEQDFELR